MGALRLRNSTGPISTLTSPFAGSIPGGVWDIADIGTLWKDTAGTSPVTADGDAVARVDDKSGNGNHLLQATLGLRPLYKTNAGLPYLLFDGTDDCLRGTFAMGTTWDRVMALRMISGGSTRQVYGGVTFNECLFDDGSGNLTMFNATSNGPTATFVIGTDYVVTERWGATCQIRTDNGAYDSTPGIAAINPGGLTVAASPSSASPTGQRWAGGVMIDKVLTAAELAFYVTKFGANQGRSL